MSTLRFRSLRVHRMPGIADGGFELRDLAAGVNVVFGPNGSGKSTTARAIEGMLWPRADVPAQAWLTGRVLIGEEEWSLELDAGRLTCRKGGVEHPAPALPAAEDRHRYLLSLTDLLDADDVGFARAIALESAGGYDLPAAASRLGMRKPQPRRGRENEELRKARERLEKAIELQEELQRRSQTLVPDETRLKARAALGARRELLQLLGDLEDRARDEREALERVETFDAAVANVVGNEVERLAALGTSREKAIGDERSAAATIERLDDEIARTGELPEDTPDLVRTLRAELGRLDEVERELREGGKRVAEVRARLDAEAALLGSTPQQLLETPPTTADLDRVARLARSLEEVRGERVAVAAELEALGTPGPPLDLDRLASGCRLLEEWLSTPAAGVSGGPRPLAIAGGVGLLLAGFAFALLHPGGWLVAAAGAVLLLLALRAPTATDGRGPLRDAFDRLGLEGGPARWETDPVRQALDGLARRLTEGRGEAIRADRRARLGAALDDLRGREAALRSQLDEVAGAFGLEPGADEPGLVWSVERLGRWYGTRAELVAAEAAEERLTSERTEALARGNRLLARLGVEPVEDRQALLARVDGIDARCRARAEALAERRLAVERRQDAAARGADAESEIQGIFDRLGIGAEDEARIPGWVAQKPAHVRARDEHGSCARERARLEERLRRHPDFAEDLLEIPAAARAAEIQQIEDELSELEAVHVRVIELRRDIERAKEGHEVEEALADVQRCEDALRASRDRDAATAVAARLVEHVEAENRDQHLPEVFHRASGLFERITHGRYSLRLDDRPEAPEFLALDAWSQVALPLDELSSATRLQLLLAVRVAFVEVQEQGMMLPLLMDETLANSDDDRAVAIMEAVRELSTGGRQVFYFTAQPDEVAKWRAVLHTPEAPVALHDLGEIRRLERRLDPLRIEAAVERPRPIPEPPGDDHAEYGRRLAVPPVDVNAPVGGLHLWYLVEECALLHRILTELRTDRWGSLATLLAHGAGRLLGDGVEPRITARADAAEVALSRLAIGSGRRVDRLTLIESQAVSDTFIDEVAALAERVGGDARRLLEGLDGREVSGFRAAKIEALRSYLDGAGCLDARAPLPFDELRAQVLGRLADALGTGILTVGEIDRLIHRLARGAGREAANATTLRLEV